MANQQIEIYIIKPKEATNLVTNPSFETGESGYSARSSSIARVTTQQRRGVYAEQITPQTNTESGIYYALALTGGTTYSFSADVLDIAGQTFHLKITNTSNVAQSSVTAWVGKGKWQRRAVSFTPGSNATYRLTLTRQSVAGTTPFYTDGWQCEVGAQSTYFDGDMLGSDRQRKDYLWLGTPHASASYRSGRTRSGGERFRLSAVAQLGGPVGLGLPPVTNHASPVGWAGSLYQKSRVENREFSIPLVFEYSQYSDILAARKQVVEAINPFALTTYEPLVIGWQLLDETGEPVSDLIFSRALYRGGLEHDAANSFVQTVDKALVGFTSFEPFLARDGDNALALGFSSSVTNFANIGYQDTEGLWKAMGSGANGAVYALAVTPDGTVYAGGAFTTIGGTSAARIAKWNGASWSALGAGLNGTVRALAIAPDGTVYAGGDFTTAGGSAANRAAVWNGSSWAALGSGANSGSVYAITVGPDGFIYIGGSFTTFAGVSTGAICKWDGSNAAGLAGVVGGTVYQIQPLGDSLAVLGDMSGTIGAVTLTEYAQWSISNLSWTRAAAAGGPIVAAANETPSSVYAVFPIMTPFEPPDTPGGAVYTPPVPRDYLYRVNTGGQEPMTVIGVQASTDDVKALAVDLDGVLWIGTTGAGLKMYRDGMIAKSSLTLPAQSSATVYAIATDSNGRVFIGGSWTGSTATASGVTAVNTGGVTAYPRFTFTGPATPWGVRNFTTGRAITFTSGLLLYSGETAVLDLRPGRVSFRSSSRGDLMQFVEAGSDLDFPLRAGSNNIAVYLTGSSGATGVTMAWNPLYISLDQAVG